MSNFKLEFKVKQHTPMIHFQHGQSGATLRATELKPKLDKFLKEKVWKGNFEEYKQYLIGKHDTESPECALDYKVNIRNNNKPEIVDITPLREGSRRRESYPNYFGNQGDNHEQYKKTSFLKDVFIIEVFSFNSSLRSIIKERFADFLMFTNFGTRQTKGFGSFYLDEADEMYKTPNLPYKFHVSSLETIRVFSQIELFYKT